MRILIATPLFPPDIGGPATYSKLLVDELPKRGVETRLVSYGEVRKLPKGLSHLAYFFLTLWRSRGCDIVYAQDPVSVGLPSAWAARILRKRFFLKVVGDFAWEQHQINNDFISLEEFQTREFDRKTNLRKKVERWVANSAEKIIVPSEYLKKIVSMWLVPRGVAGRIPPEKITVIYNAFDPVEILEGKAEIKRQLGLSGSVILTAGRLVPWKGIDALIDIMPGILNSRPETKLVIVGEGPEEKRLRDLASLPPPRNVLFTGRLSQAELYRYIKAADAFALNSSYEGFSHQLLEVMSIGTPIVASSAGGNTELLADGENGFLVEHNDKAVLKERILALLAISDVSQKFSRAGKETVAGFSKERMFNEIIKILL